MTRVHRRNPLRLLAFTALLSLGACGDDTDSPPGEFSPPTRRGAITVGMGTGLGWLLDTGGVIRQADLRLAGGTADDWSVLGSADLVAPAAIASDGAGFLHIMDTGRGAVVVLNRPGYEVGRYGEGDMPIEDSSSNDLPRSHHRRRLAVGESGLVIFSVDSQIAPIYAP